MDGIWEGPKLESPLQKGNLVGFLFKDSHRWNNLPALECGYTGKTHTYGELRAVIGRWGAWLTLQRGGAPQPPVVARFARCSVEVVVVHLGTMAVGVACTALGNLSGTNEIVAQLENCGATLLVASAEFVPRLKEALQKLGRQIPVVVIGDASAGDTAGMDVVATYRDIMEDETLTPLEPVQITGEETSQLIYTSGTTGFPKSVEHSHNSIIAVLQTYTHPHFYPRLNTNHDIEQTRILMVRDIGLSYGLMFLLSPGLLLGACVIVKQLDEATFVEDIERLKIHSVGLVSQNLPLLVQLGKQRPDLQRTLRHVGVGGCPIPDVHVKTVEELLPNVFLQKMYGASEVGMVSMDPIGGGKRGFSGKVAGNLSVKVVGEGGQLLPPNRKGVLFIKSPGKMKGYLNNPAATRKEFDDDGWYNSGDLALVDEDGYVKIFDRVKELIKLNDASTASPAELEDVILELPGVREVCVVGALDATTGSDAIYVFAAKDLNLEPEVTEEDVKNYITQQMNKQKRPKRVIFMNALPCIHSGKLDRQFLKTEAAKLENVH